MLRNKLFKALAALVVIYGVLCVVVGWHMIQTRVVSEAQDRVKMDLNGAWALYNYRLSEIETIMKLVAAKKTVVDGFKANEWEDEALRGRLASILNEFKLSFITIVDSEGKVLMRSGPPFARGDLQSSDPVVAKALRGEAVSCTKVMRAEALERECGGLAEKAYIVLEETPRAKPTTRPDEARGMVMVGAVPVMDGARVAGAVYGGVLLNRNHSLVDSVTETLFEKKTYNGKPMGTATLFLGDCRITTTVRKANGNRAVGTRASKEVAERVLENGASWVGPAFVVSERYLTAYDPIRDISGEVIGMLYVGILERPFRAMGREMMVRYSGLVLVGLVLSVVLAFIMASRLSAPLHRLVSAADRMRKGEKPEPVAGGGTCREIDTLANSFNDMSAALHEREDRLKALNRSYMETLGFVSHELKGPTSTIMNYAFLLRGKSMGPLTEKQEKAVRIIDAGSARLVEMVRHYLNLSRIENGNMTPSPSKVAVLDDVVSAIVDSLEAEMKAKNMRVENTIANDIAVYADANMVVEVFENLLHNAVKYGRDGGLIRLAAGLADEFVEFSVWNEGKGIQPDKIGLLFQKFSRLDVQNGEKRQKGTGLGLFITRHIVEAHGGRIEARSQFNEWVEFKFTLPVFKQETAAPAAAG